MERLFSTAVQSGQELSARVDSMASAASRIRSTTPLAEKASRRVHFGPEDRRLSPPASSTGPTAGLQSIGQALGSMGSLWGMASPEEYSMGTDDEDEFDGAPVRRSAMGGGGAARGVSERHPQAPFAPAAPVDPALMIQLEMLKTLKDMRKRRSGVDSSDSDEDSGRPGQSSFKGLMRMRAAMIRNPEQAVKAYANWVRSELGIEHESQYWT